MEGKLEAMECHVALHLAEFEPEERYQRRHWIDNLCVSYDIVFMKKSYGGQVGNINVIWKIDQSDENHEANMAKTVLTVNKSLPESPEHQSSHMQVQKRRNNFHLIASVV